MANRLVVCVSDASLGGGVGLHVMDDDVAQYAPSVDRSNKHRAGFSIPAHSPGYGRLECEPLFELHLLLIKWPHFRPPLLFFFALLWHLCPCCRSFPTSAHGETTLTVAITIQWGQRRRGVECHFDDRNVSYERPAEGRAAPRHWC